MDTPKNAYTRSLEQFTKSNGFKRLQEQLASSPAYIQSLEQFTKSNGFKRLQEQFSNSYFSEHVMASSTVSGSIGDFVDQFDYSPVDEIVDAIAQSSAEFDVEKFADEKPEDVFLDGLSHADAEWEDPIRKAIFKHSAERFTRIQERYPHYSERAIDGLNKISEIIAYNFIIQLLALWITGVAAPLFAPMITAVADDGVEYIRNKRGGK